MRQQTVVHKRHEAKPLDLRELARHFEKNFGLENPRYFYAPGRVNLIGEHTDYNEGFVLPIAIGMGTIIAGLPRMDRRVRVYSLGENETVEFGLDAEEARPKGHWINYVEGVARSLEERGFNLQGADLLIAGNVPVGSGLSSSAALENATAYALLSLSGLPVTDRVQIALAGQAAEHKYVGTQCGVMDQLVTALGHKDHALLIDCRSLETSPVPMNLPDVAVVICDSRVKHSLASSAYNQRVEECRRGVRALREGILDLHSLRDVDEALFEHYQSLLTDEIVRKRVRHVVTENARTLKAARALREGDVDELGRLMFASHESLKNDYEISCPELDTLVEIARGLQGVIGARMTGGGFGGCTVNLVKKSALPDFIETVVSHYEEAFGQVPHIYITEAGEGMQEILSRHSSGHSQSELNQLLNERFDQAFNEKRLGAFIEFADEQMPPLSQTVSDIALQANLTRDSNSDLPAMAEITRGDLRLTVSREFGIRLYDRGRQLTTDVKNIPRDYPWFMPDPDDPEAIAEYATRHVARGSRGESPWPENVWPQIGGVRQGEQNWPHREAAFGPYRIEFLNQDKNQPAIVLSLPSQGGQVKPNPYGVIPRGIFTVTAPNSILMALQHENHSEQGLSWSPWFVLGFAVPKEGTLTNPSTILAFPDSEADDPVQDRITKVWNYADIDGQKVALINPHAKTLNEPFKKLYRDVNWSVIAFKGSDQIILTRSILRHEEQFFPFLEHGRYFIEVEHTGLRVPPGRKSTVLIRHDLVPVSDLSEGAMQALSHENHRFENDVRALLKTLIARLRNGELLSNYRS